MRIIMIIYVWLSMLHAQENLLKYESSLYLQQHKDNPVHWHAWNKETLALAKKSNKPILLSIGYSTCHWCHVMAKESFIDVKIAKLINENYIAIKVDKEERPDLDHFFQGQYKKVKGKSGGWPLTLILTPRLETIFMATYLPKEAKYGVNSFTYYLKEYKTFFKDKKTVARLIQTYKEDKKTSKSFGGLDLKRLQNNFIQQFDTLYAGFGRGHKFADVSKLELLLLLDENNQSYAQNMLITTLNAMALKGMYDSIDGGFFRYSTDPGWNIPHFEKMLYNNAQLIGLYAKAYERFHKPLYKQVVKESITMLEQRFLDKTGLFSSASNADSMGEEGGYYTFNARKLESILTGLTIDESEDEAIDTIPNFENKVHFVLENEQRPSYFKALRNKLKALRKTKTYPFIDTKKVTAFNAMMVTAYFKAGAHDETYIHKGQVLLENIEQKCMKSTVLYHQYIKGEPLKEAGKLEDFAYLIEAYLEGYHSTLKRRYLTKANQLMQDALKTFYSDKQWISGKDFIVLPARRDDKSYASGRSIQIKNLQVLAPLLENTYYQNIALQSLKGYTLNQDVSNAKEISEMFFKTTPRRVVYASKQLIVKAKKSLAYNSRLLYKVKPKQNFYTVCGVNACYAKTDTIQAIIKVP